MWCWPTIRCGSIALMLVVMMVLEIVMITTAMTKLLLLMMMVTLYPDSVKGQWSRVALAYQPVWATGTCKMILPEEVEDMHKVLRAWMDTNVSPVDACQTRIIYGGQRRMGGGGGGGGGDDDDLKMK